MTALHHDVKLGKGNRREACSTKRAQIQIDEEVYELLRNRAFKEKKSIAGVIREIVRKDIYQPDQHRSSSIKDFTFIGIGRSKQGPLKPVSERHDEALKGVFKK